MCILFYNLPQNNMETNMNWGSPGPYGPSYQPQTPMPPWWWFAPQQQPTITQPPSADELRKAYKKGKKEHRQFLKWVEEQEKKKPKKEEEKKPRLSVLQWTCIIALSTITMGPWVAYVFAASMHASLFMLSSLFK